MVELVIASRYGSNPISFLINPYDFNLVKQDFMDKRGFPYVYNREEA